MPIFEYAGTDAGGVAVKGVEIGADLDAASRKLVEKGVALETIRPAGATGSPPREAPRAVETPLQEPGVIPERSYMETSVWGPLIGGVPLKDLGFFFRQFAVMQHAGVPIVQSIDTLGRQAPSPKLQEILRETGLAVERGFMPSDVFSRYPEVFPSVQVAILRAGERGGFVEDASRTIADYLDREMELRNMYRRITFYPKLQIVVSMLIIMVANAIIGSVAPGAKGLWSPLTTLSTWYWLGPLLIGLFLFVRVGLANGSIRRWWHFFIRLIPGYGKTMHELAMAKWGRAFAALYRGGVEMPEAFRLASEATGNEDVRRKLVDAPKYLQEGEGLAHTLRGTNAFSPIVLDMVQTGETTGNLDQMLDSMSRFYEDEAETRGKQLAQTFGVFIGLCVAIYIAIIIISFWSSYGQGYTDQMK